ncbi:O(6)-methylguanine-induced apoptosis 2 isoform X1 [Cynoglossus semilaevis]|nr:O(6)-methylguanine-induced apoptosis 2 isoform X1 [Cynoglossus semilaevis]XP_024921016.1 O(6)-methylguanine-induced apoptosis 2 isoform X1 [Cynoglossus semilaevis]XP_024921017.1 O(6)-methylguanine-induced apoptosis 2 isoform X1 [Cynoglossus semilaevis]
METTNQEKKWLTCQAKRFSSEDSPNGNPGPGSYNFTTSAEVMSPSFSKKGTTGFVASKAFKGYFNPQRSVPAPNLYNLQSSFINKYDFNIGTSRVFRMPVVWQRAGPKNEGPAPNQYDVSCGFTQMNSSLFGTSAFLSKPGWSSFCPNTDVPSPCHYHVRNHSIQTGSTAVLSPFKSTSRRIPALVDHHVPGPGAYSPHQAPTAVKKTTLPRTFGLTIAESAVVLPKGPPFPGPGHYNVGTCYSVSNCPIPTAAFASKTARSIKLSQEEVKPGPGFYNPRVLTKSSFIYNDSRFWVPV